jgi:hypothetical protein
MINLIITYYERDRIILCNECCQDFSYRREDREKLGHKEVEMIMIEKAWQK